MKTEAIIFDYGNTLIEFSSAQLRLCDRALGSAIRELYGELDVNQFHKIREQMRQSMFKENPPNYRERDLKEATADLLRRLHGVAPTPEQVEIIREARGRVFVDVVQLPKFLHNVLGKLKKRHKIALLSNYPSGRDIRTSLDKIDITQYFDVIVVSGEVGYAKPHPKPFEIVLSQLSCPKECVIHVGDNWLADIQGAARMGIRAIHTTQYQPYEKIERKEDDFPPVATIEHLQELDGLLVPK